MFLFVRAITTTNHQLIRTPYITLTYFLRNRMREELLIFDSALALVAVGPHDAQNIYIFFSSQFFLRSWQNLYVVFLFFTYKKTPVVIYSVHFDTMSQQSIQGDCKETPSQYMPVNIFDTSKISRSGPKVLREQPLKTARLLINRGLEAINKKNTRLSRIWRYTTGFDD